MLLQSQRVIAGVIKEKAGRRDLLAQQLFQDLGNVNSEQKSLVLHCLTHRKHPNIPPDLLFLFLFTGLLASERRNGTSTQQKSTLILLHREVSF